MKKTPREADYQYNKRQEAQSQIWVLSAQDKFTLTRETLELSLNISKQAPKVIILSLYHIIIFYFIILIM